MVESHVFDVSGMEPQLACPHSVDNVDTLAHVTANREIKLSQGYIGSCTGGREEDIAVAARIVKGRHIPPYSRLVVVPASSEVMLSCMAKRIHTGSDECRGNHNHAWVRRLPGRP